MENMKIDIFADGADIKSIKKLDKNLLIKGFTTNPTLMRQSGIKNYLEFAKNIARAIKKKPISLEVFSDKIQEMEQQALILSKISKNFNVKIPITNSKSLSTAKLIARLSSNGVVCNVTAIFTFNQVRDVMKLLPKNTKIILSPEATKSLDNVIPKMKQDIKVLIGPEGDFTKQELDFSIQKGFSPIKIGPRILRTETAPMCILSILQYKYGDIV